MTAPSAILIAGPTASGKSALALALAERRGGTIVNADAMQVYRDLRVLTARPTAEDEARVPHALYGFVSARDAYSAGRFIRDAKSAIEAARAAGRQPIVVGGTGLYFKALLEGLSPVPAIPADVRARWRAEVERLGAPAVHACLARRDPEMARRFQPTDPQRIVRALEVLDATGRSLAEWQQGSGEPVLREAETVRLVAAVEREELYRRCNARFDAMMDTGALDEVARLQSLDLDPGLPILRALGVRPLLAFLSGALTREEAVTAAKTETRRYVKRQATWLKRHMMSWTPIKMEYMKWKTLEDLSFIDRLIDGRRSAP